MRGLGSFSPPNPAPNSTLPLLLYHFLSCSELKKASFKDFVTVQYPFHKSQKRPKSMSFSHSICMRTIFFERQGNNDKYTIQNSCYLGGDGQNGIREGHIDPRYCTEW